MISLFAGVASWAALALPTPEGSISALPTYALPLTEAPSAAPGRAGRGGFIGGVEVAPNAQIGIGIFKSRVKDRDFPGSDVLGGPKGRRRNAGVGLRFSF